MDNEKIENKVKSFIVSVNGEGITMDYLVKTSEDFEVLDAMVTKVKNRCKLNDELLKEPQTKQQ